jgi:hypothetical protein
MNFIRNSNELQSLSIGKIQLIKDWLDLMDIKNYYINKNLTINVIGAVNLSHSNLEKFPDYIQFNKIGGDFWCNDNKLNNLIGCPFKVHGTFDCCGNDLISLDGCPRYVSEDFYYTIKCDSFRVDDILKLCKVNPSRVYNL